MYKTVQNFFEKQQLLIHYDQISLVWATPMILVNVLELEPDLGSFGVDSGQMILDGWTPVI